MGTFTTDCMNMYDADLGVVSPENFLTCDSDDDDSDVYDFQIKLSRCDDPLCFDPASAAGRDCSSCQETSGGTSKIGFRYKFARDVNLLDAVTIELDSSLQFYTSKELTGVKMVQPVKYFPSEEVVLSHKIDFPADSEFEGRLTMHMANVTICLHKDKTGDAPLDGFIDIASGAAAGSAVQPRDGCDLEGWTKYIADNSLDASLNPIDKEWKIIIRNQPNFGMLADDKFGPGLSTCKLDNTVFDPMDYSYQCTPANRQCGWGITTTYSEGNAFDAVKFLADQR